MNLFKALIATLCLAQSAYASIIIDGDANDWSTSDRLDVSASVAVSGYNLYGRYEDGQYKFLLKSDAQQIGASTTFWLNTDQDPSTGYQIFGVVGGAEYNVNIHTDGAPYLYSGAAAETYINGPLEHAIVEQDEGSTLEFAIPEALIGTPTSSSIHVLIDVNNTDFMPSFYSSSHYYNLKRETAVVVEPQTPASDRRIGIVYSQATSDNFWSAKSYSQLYMSVQAQAMMAGIPFDLLKEEDLLDVSNLIKYDALVFPYNANVSEDNAVTVEENLVQASSVYGVGIITAGNFLTNNEVGGALIGDSYARMKTLLGITRENGAGPANIEVNAQPSSLGALPSSLYTLGDKLLSYSGGYTDYFIASGDLQVETLATQNIDTVGVKNAVLASQQVSSNAGKIARNAHFASVLFMGDSNMLWPILRWSVYGDEVPATLQMGREAALFISRNDMDQSMYIDQVKAVEGALFTMLKKWKNKYNFVGSYYINEGNDAANGQRTNWTYSKKLYNKYIALGNEIGTHSYTHPHDTNILTDAEIKTEFDDHQLILKDKMGLATVGAAVPGAPEDFRTAKEIIQYVSYLTGGYSSTGAGFPNAIGFLSPDFDKVYFSPNMTFDFTNVEFLGLTAEESQQKWLDEIDTLFNRASQPILHWPWHDYGPTNSDNAGYTFDMFESVIVKAKAKKAEFVTADDMRQRIETFQKTALEVDQVSSEQIDLNVTSNNAGRFAVNVGVTAPQKIKSVDGWYAYTSNKVFLDSDAGTYRVNLGNTQDVVTRIYYLPSRANLLSLNGDGEDLQFSFSGEGIVRVKTNCGVKPVVTGGDIVRYNANRSILTLKFRKFATHNVNVDMTCP